MVKWLYSGKPSNLSILREAIIKKRVYPLATPIFLENNTIIRIKT